MSKKAEDMYLTCFLDGRARNISVKEAFNMGYSLAEKDNALTWEDLRCIHRICADTLKDTTDEDFLTEKYYKEVLRRFLELKENKV